VSIWTKLGVLNGIHDDLEREHTLMSGQGQKILAILTKIMTAFHESLDQAAIDETDLGTEYTLAGDYQPTLDDLLKRWQMDTVGTSLRQGVRKIGELFIPLATANETHLIIDEVAQRAPNEHRARAIMNHMFDGHTTYDGTKFLAWPSRVPCDDQYLFGPLPPSGRHSKRPTACHRPSAVVRVEAVAAARLPQIGP
jgi:hypothetical protein